MSPRGYRPKSGGRPTRSGVRSLGISMFLMCTVCCLLFLVFSGVSLWRLTAVALQSKSIMVACVIYLWHM